MDLQTQTDARLLRTIECYLSELLCNAETADEVNTVAEALVAVQGALTTLDGRTSFAA